MPYANHSAPAVSDFPFTQSMELRVQPVVIAVRSKRLGLKIILKMEGISKMSEIKGWIGVDLDGTLAEYHGWLGENHIGKPIPLMVDRVRQWLSDGKIVKIFTARAYDPHYVDFHVEPMTKREVVKVIENWCKEHIGVVLPVVCTKDYGMIELWDDRAVQVISNKGIALQDLIK